MKGVVYFDKNKEFNWLTDTSLASADAYRTMAQDQYMNQAPSPPPPPLPPFRNGLNGGPDGAPLGDGGSGSQLVTTTVSAGAHLVFDDDKAPYGKFAAKHILPSETADSYYEWRGERLLWYGRIYVRLKQLPSDNLRIIRARYASDLRGSINVSPGGALVFMDQDNDVVMRTATPILTRRWVRIEWVIDHPDQAATVMLFNRPNSQTATEIVSSNDVDIGYSTNEYHFGRSGSEDFAVTFWTDGPAISSGGFLGPIRSTRR